MVRIVRNLLVFSVKIGVSLATLQFVDGVKKYNGILVRRAIGYFLARGGGVYLRPVTESGLRQTKNYKKASNVVGSKSKKMNSDTGSRTRGPWVKTRNVNHLHHIGC